MFGLGHLCQRDIHTLPVCDRCLGDIVVVDDAEGACPFNAGCIGHCGAFTNSLSQPAKFIGSGGVPRLFEARVPSELFVHKQLSRFHVEHGEGCQEACCQRISRASLLWHRLLSGRRRQQVGHEVGRAGPRLGGSGVMDHWLRLLGRDRVLRWHPWMSMGCHPWS